MYQGISRGDLAEVVDPSVHHGSDQVFFGATVTYVNSKDEERTVKIVGVDEVDLEIGHVSWVSPIAKALIKARLGDCVKIQTPTGPSEIEILDVQYL